MKSEKITVDQTADIVVDGSSGSANYPMSAVFYNTGPNDVYIGGRDVTTANGYKMTTATPAVSMDLINEVVYGVCAAAETATISVLRRGS